MLRVAALCALSGAILVLTGCASDLPSTPAPKGAGRVSQGASTVIIKIKTCETTYVQDNACAVPKTCPKIATCAETDYLLKVCGHPLDKNKNNVPCEVTGPKCGRTPEEMAEKIKKEGGPFSPPRRQLGERRCSEPA